MIDIEIEAGFENAPAERLAHALWTELRRSLNAITYPVAQLVAHQVVERLRAGGMTDAEIVRYLDLP